jgi:phytoene synthase
VASGGLQWISVRALPLFIHYVTPEQYCQDKAAPPGSSLYYSILSLPPDKRHALAAIYAFREEVLSIALECADSGVARMKLAWWRGEIRSVYRGAPSHPVVKALAANLDARNLPLELWNEMIDGAEMDIAQDPYPDFAALKLYCYRTGAVVAIMAAQILGYQEREPCDCVHDLGIGLALCRLIREAGNDARRGRVYLPQDEMTRFGVTRTDMLDCQESDHFRRMIEFQIERAIQYLETARSEFPTAARKSLTSLLILAAIQQALLEEIRSSGCRVLSARTSLTPVRKLWIAWRTRLRS